MLDALFAMYGMGIQRVVQPHFLFRHVRQIVNIIARANADIALHLLHPVQIDLGPGSQALLRSAQQHASQHCTISQLNEGISSCLADFLHNSLQQIPLAADHFNQHILAGLNIDGVAHKILSQFLNSGISHTNNFLPSVPKHYTARKNFHMPIYCSIPAGKRKAHSHSLPISVKIDTQDRHLLP
ncbi:hypothetical protein D3C73_1094980 [compost metagenome]